MQTKVAIFDLFLILLLPGPLACAQFTKVTGTVIDPNGVPYGFGTIVGILNFSGGTPKLPNGTPYLIPTQPSGLDGNGRFVVQLADNTQITPGGSTWNFTVCSGQGTVLPSIGKGSVCFSLPTAIAISGSSQDISKQLNANAPALTTTIGVRTVFDVRNYGAVGDGATNDLAALQSAVDAIDTAGGGTLWLGAGSYNIGTGTWKIATSAQQHHINILGVSQNQTTIIANTSGGNAAIYLNLEKYVSLREFSVVNTGTKAGYGIQFGGDLGTGTQTNGNQLEHIGLQNFQYGAFMSGGIGTSSEIVFDHPVFQNNTYGFYSANFNALNFLFLMPEIYGNSTAGFFISTGNMTVIGGASSNNGVDFLIQGGNDGQVKIMEFRAETPVGDWLQVNANNYTSVEDCIVHPTSNGSEVINATAELHIKNSTLNGFITWNGSTLSAITLDHVAVNTPGTDWSLSNQLSSASPPYGPGFRMTNTVGFQASARVYIHDVLESSTNTMYPDLDGVLIARPSDSKRSIVGITKGQGSALTITSNVVSPFAYVHHVGAGLIKNLTPVAGFGDWATQLVLIPDAAFTTDTTGNIGKTSTAVIGQPMTFVKDLASGTWFPSY